MSNVITPASLKVSRTAAIPANTTPTNQHGAPAGIERQQAIENALSMALYHVRHGSTQQAIHAAMVKAVRAASMLKQACAEITIGGRA